MPGIEVSILRWLKELTNMSFGIPKVKTLTPDTSYLVQSQNVLVFAGMKTPRNPTNFRTDNRRKHHHWKVVVFYKDGERFARTYTVHAKAISFAERQKKSPVVKMARVTKVS